MSRRLLGLPLRHVVTSGRSYSLNALRRPNVQLAQPLRPSQRRYKGSFAENARELFQKHPLSVSGAAIVILGGMACMAYANYYYQHYIIGAWIHYPEPVAVKLRRAVYYNNVDFQPLDALKYYHQALQVAEELGMDSFSDEIMGVKIQVSLLMEKIKLWNKAIEVLERVRGENMMWLERFGDREEYKKHRTRILGKTVGIAIKLADLYANPSVWDRDLAEERLVWAVETTVKEEQRRQANHVTTEDEGDWLGGETIGATIEALAHHYEAEDQHYLAAPLFLQALSLYPTRDCHSVVLMNNLAASLAQQSPRAAREVQAFASSKDIKERPVGPLATRETMVENAKQWAQKSLEIAAGIQPPLRTEECDMGCATGMYNLGGFAEMLNDYATAELKYKEALSLSRAIGYQEGIDQSSDRLRELKQRE